MSEIFNKAVKEAEKLSTQDNAKSVLDNIYSTLGNIDPPLTIARKLGLNIPSGEDLTTLVQTVAEGVSPGTDIREIVEGSEKISEGNVVSGGLQTLSGLAGVAIPFSKQIRRIGKVVDDTLLKSVKPLDVGVDESLLSGKFLKNYTENDFNILDDLVNKGKVKLKGLKANKLLNAPIEGGRNIGVRLNLNSEILDAPKNLKPKLQTIHEKTATGKALSYKPYATVVGTDKKKVKFYVSPSGRENIATGKVSKHPAMSVNGAYEPNLKILPSDPNVVEIGFNPKAHHLFIDLKTGQAVKEADAATVIGDRVYAKGVTYFKKSEAPKPKTAPSQVRYKEKKKGGQISTGLEGIGENTIYRSKDGEGLSSIGESIINRATGGDIITSAYNRPIPRVIYRDKGGKIKQKKDGGGLSNLKKSINIKGQPHKLAWINPDEASLLKAMGGSGKKVGGIPAYYYDTMAAEAYTDFYGGDDTGTAGGTEDQTDTGEVSYYMRGTPTDKDNLSQLEVSLGLPEGSLHPETGIGRGGSDEFEGRSGLATIGDRAITFQALGKIPGALERFKESMRDQVPADVYSTYFNALLEKTGDMDKTQKIVDAALAIPGMPEELIARFEGSKSLSGKGYMFGGPAETVKALMETDVRNSLEAALDRKDRALMEQKTTDEDKYGEETSLIGVPGYELAELIEKGEVPGMSYQPRAELTNPYESLGLAKWVVPGGMITSGIVGLINAIGDLSGIVGTVTIGGKEYGLTEDGQIVDTQIAEAPDTGNEIESPYRSAIPSPTKTVTESVKEAGPMETFQAGLKSIDLDSNTANKIKILMDQYGISENQARQMIGLEINVA